MSLLRKLSRKLARPSVLRLAEELRAFDRWAIASGFSPEDPDAAEIYRALGGTK